MHDETELVDPAHDRLEPADALEGTEDRVERTPEGRVAPERLDPLHDARPKAADGGEGEDVGRDAAGQSPWSLGGATGSCHGCGRLDDGEIPVEADLDAQPVREAEAAEVGLSPGPGQDPGQPVSAGDAVQVEPGDVVRREGGKGRPRRSLRPEAPRWLRPEDGSHVVESTGDEHPVVDGDRPGLGGPADEDDLDAGEAVARPGEAEGIEGGRRPGPGRGRIGHRRQEERRRPRGETATRCGDAPENDGCLAAEPGVDPARPVEPSVAASGDGALEEIGELRLQKALVVEAGEVGEEAADPVPLVARQVEAELGVGDAVGRCSGEEARRTGAADEEGDDDGRGKDDGARAADGHGPADLPGRPRAARGVARASIGSFHEAARCGRRRADLGAVHVSAARGSCRAGLGGRRRPGAGDAGAR